MPRHSGKQFMFAEFMTQHGFEPITVNTWNVFWKAIDDSRHIIVETQGDKPHLFPDFKSRYALISIYRGPDLKERLVHQETAYLLEDLVVFLKQMENGEILCA